MLHLQGCHHPGTVLPMVGGRGLHAGHGGGEGVPLVIVIEAAAGPASQLRGWLLQGPRPWVGWGGLLLPLQGFIGDPGRDEGGCHPGSPNPGPDCRRGVGDGGCGVPGAAPLTALFLLTILSSLRAIRATSSSLPIVAWGTAPPKPAAPASASASGPRCQRRAARHRLPHPPHRRSPAAGSKPSVQTNPRPAPAGPRGMLGRVVPAPPVARALASTRTTTPRGPLGWVPHSLPGNVV